MSGFVITLFFPNSNYYEALDSIFSMDDWREEYTCLFASDPPAGVMKNLDPVPRLAAPQFLLSFKCELHDFFSCWYTDITNFVYNSGTQSIICILGFGFQKKLIDLILIKICVFSYNSPNSILILRDTI
jgi:hypothetical protein